MNNFNELTFNIASGNVLRNQVWRNLASAIYVLSAIQLLKFSASIPASRHTAVENPVMFQDRLLPYLITAWRAYTSDGRISYCLLIRGPWFITCVRAWHHSRSICRCLTSKRGTALLPQHWNYLYSTPSHRYFPGRTVLFYVKLVHFVSKINV